MIYRFLIDPIMFPSHNFVVSQIQKGERVIDIACGNGTLSMLIEKKTGREVTGIDVDPVKIAEAEKAGKRKKSLNTRFMVKDATDLSDFATGDFDTAVISMAIHQFSPADGLKVMQEAKRLADKIVILDYACPIRNIFYRYFTHVIERIAGREHYRNFRQYMQRGGVESIAGKVNLLIKERHVRSGGTLMILHYNA